MPLFPFSKKKHFFPDSDRGRREIIMKVHEELAPGDLLRNKSTLDILIEQISGETDTFLLTSYVMYYIGYYKPFNEANEDTAKIIVDGIFGDHGLAMPQDPTHLAHFRESCNNRFTIESIMEWQKSHIRKQ